MKCTRILIVLFALCVTNCKAQPLSTKDVEDDLVHEYSKLSAFGYSSNYDSIVYQDSVFRNKILHYTQRYNFTLTYPFKTLIDSCKLDIVTSKDGLFRIYSWDTWSGGTMHNFNNVFQFKSGNNVYAKLLYDSSEDQEGDALSYYSEIYMLTAKNKVYYLAVSNGIYSTSDAGQSIKIFTIRDSSLNDTVQIIKNDTGLQNEIGIEYDFFSVVDRPERPIKLIKYDAAKRIIYIPIVSDEGKVTDKFTRYQFNGRYFVKMR